MPFLEDFLGAFGIVIAFSSYFIYTLVIYFFMKWDARDEDSDSYGDQQIGIKSVIATLALISLPMALFGIYTILRFLLTFENFDSIIDFGVPTLLTGAIFAGATLFVLLPKTNVEEYPKVKRMFWGTITLFAGLLTIAGTLAVLLSIFNWDNFGMNWDRFASLLAAMVIIGPLALVSFVILSRNSGMADMVDLGGGGGGGGGEYATQMTSPPAGGYQQQQQSGPAQPPGGYQQQQPQAQPQQPAGGQQGGQNWGQQQGGGQAGGAQPGGQQGGQNWGQQEWDQSGGGGGGWDDNQGGGGGGGGGQGWS